MESYYRYTRAEISLDDLRHNLSEFRRTIPAHMKMMAVLKADAYGHGSIAVAREALASGADYLAVAFLDEAIELRQAGVECPILIFGYTGPDDVGVALEHDLTLTVYTDEVLDRLIAIRKKHPARIHIKIDTGMGRVGIAEEAEAIRFVRKAAASPEIEVEALYTHFACADEIDKSYTLYQHERFKRLIDRLAEEQLEFPLNHAGNSATGIEFPQLSCNMIRIGISMYGFYPSQEVHRERVNLRPVMSFKTGVVMIKQLPSGSGISYGATYRTAGTETIATLPVGYADGYSRLLSGKSEVIIHGQRVPIVGRICMDQCMVNVTGIPDVSIGDEVVLFGEQDGTVVTADEVADWLGTIHYEVVCMVSSRVPRVYLRNGEVIAVENGLIRQSREERDGYA